jgi:putative ABC transport system substrate-binding protein
MRRRAFITLLGGAAAWPVAAHAQQPKNIPRLCFLTFDRRDVDALMTFAGSRR